MVEEGEDRDKGVGTSLQAVENKEQNHTVKKEHNYCDYCEKSRIGFHPCGYLTCRWMPRFTERIAKISAIVYAQKERQKEKEKS